MIEKGHGIRISHKALEGKTFSSIFLFPHLLTRNRPVSLTAEYLHIAFASEKKQMYMLESTEELNPVLERAVTLL